MTKNEIEITDWYRILIGDVPVSFFIEAFVRLSVVYLILIFSMRLMGKRMASRLSRNELVAIVTLAAATGMPIQSPDRGIVPAVIIAAFVVCAQRWVSSHSVFHPVFERMSQGDIALLAENGVLQWRDMIRSRISKEKIVAFLRSQGIKHLGEVKLLYLEASGAFTLIRAMDEQPGLSVLPDWDTDFSEKQKKTPRLVCKRCGQQKDQNVACPNCNTTVSVAAITIGGIG